MLQRELVTFGDCDIGRGFVMYDEETIQTIYNEHRGGEIYAKDENSGQSIGDKLYSKQKDIQDHISRI